MHACSDATKAGLKRSSVGSSLRRWSASFSPHHPQTMAAWARRATDAWCVVRAHHLLGDLCSAPPPPRMKAAHTSTWPTRTPSIATTIKYSWPQPHPPRSPSPSAANSQADTSPTVAGCSTTLAMLPSTKEIVQVQHSPSHAQHPRLCALLQGHRDNSAPLLRADQPPRDGLTKEMRDAPG